MHSVRQPAAAVRVAASILAGCAGSAPASRGVPPGQIASTSIAGPVGGSPPPGQGAIAGAVVGQSVRPPDAPRPATPGPTGESATPPTRAEDAESSCHPVYLPHTEQPLCVVGPPR